MGLGRRGASPEATIDLAPVLAIPLVLLVFFLTPLRFSGEAQIAVGSPATDQAAEGRTIAVGISGAGTVHVEGKRLDLGNLRQAISRLLLAAPGARVMVVADESSRAVLITRVIDECRQAGASRIDLSLRTEGARRGN